MGNKGILNGNHLKLIAAFTMLLDHAGILLFPHVKLLRILGRLAYPIFAYMIAEGCRYTKNNNKNAALQVKRGICFIFLFCFSFLGYIILERNQFRLRKYKLRLLG